MAPYLHIRKGRHEAMLTACGSGRLKSTTPATRQRFRESHKNDIRRHCAKFPKIPSSAVNLDSQRHWHRCAILRLSAICRLVAEHPTRPRFYPHRRLFHDAHRLAAASEAGKCVPRAQPAYTTYPTVDPSRRHAGSYSSMQPMPVRLGPPLPRKSAACYPGQPGGAPPNSTVPAATG